MKSKLCEWSRRYVAALRKHLEPGGAANWGLALQLSRGAAALGLEPRELALKHAQALARLKVSGQPLAMRRAQQFLGKMIRLVIEPGSAARLNLRPTLTKALGLCTAKLAATRQRLRRDILRRRQLEAASQKNQTRSARQIQNSLRRQAVLRKRFHRMLAAHETARHQHSLILQNEIAQTLLGINVALLNLRQAARDKSRGWHTGIAITQSLVKKSARTLRRATRHIAHA